MSRLYDLEATITAEVEGQGRPVAVTWLEPEPLREVINRWRVDADRWRVPISRTYYTVITPTMKLEIYRDDCAGDWYRQRVID